MRISESQLRRIVRRVIAESKTPVVSRRRAIDEGPLDALKKFFGDKKGTDKPYDHDAEAPLAKLPDDVLKAAYEKAKNIESDTWFALEMDAKGIDPNGPEAKEILKKMSDKNMGLIKDVMGILTKAGVDLKNVTDVEGLVKGEYNYRNKDKKKDGPKKTSYGKQLRADSSSHWF